MELLAPYSMSEVRREYKAYFGDYRGLTKGFWAVKKSPKEVWPLTAAHPHPPTPPSAEKVTLSMFFLTISFDRQSDRPTDRQTNQQLDF